MLSLNCAACWAPISELIWSAIAGISSLTILPILSIWSCMSSANALTAITTSASSTFTSSESKSAIMSSNIFILFSSTDSVLLIASLTSSGFISSSLAISSTLFPSFCNLYIYWMLSFSFLSAIFLPNICIPCGKASSSRPFRKPTTESLLLPDTSANISSFSCIAS